MVKREKKNKFERELDAKTLNTLVTKRNDNGNKSGLLICQLKVTYTSPGVYRDSDHEENVMILIAGRGMT